jgi:hypothetical protein
LENVHIFKKKKSLLLVYGCETSSLTLRAEHTLRVFEDRVLRTIFGPKRDDVYQGSGEDYITRSFMVCTLRQLFFEWSNQEELDGWGMWHACGRGEMHTGICWGNLRERDHLEDLNLNGRILKWIFKKWNGEA